MTDYKNPIRGQIELRIGTHSAKIRAELPREAAGLDSILPAARQITEAVVSWAVADTESAGKRISCRAGCGACCRQAVPIGPTEARRLPQLVSEMPEPRRSRVAQRFEQAIARLRETGLLDSLERLAVTDRDTPPGHYNGWAVEYFHLGIPCPFLENESCSIHSERPLVCREYLVTSNPSECATLSRDGIERVPIKASVAKAYRKLEHRPGTNPFMPLVMALEWAAAETPGVAKRRPALEWVKNLQKLLARPEVGADIDTDNAGNAATMSDPGSQPRLP
jgi:Fe-S-cluster containining protein